MSEVTTNLNEDVDHKVFIGHRVNVYGLFGANSVSVDHHLGNYGHDEDGRISSCVHWDIFHLN